MKNMQEIISELEVKGYSLIENLLPNAIVGKVRIDISNRLAKVPFGDNNFVGMRTKRLYSLFGETRSVDEIATNETILEIVKEYCGDVLLGASVACQIHPGETEQAFHFDDGIYPLPSDFHDVNIGVIWALDDFTIDNGATVVIPNSHKKRDMKNPEKFDQTEIIVMPKGSALIYSGSLWHAGGANQSDSTRLAIILQYVESWLRPQDTHLISIQIPEAKKLDSRLQALLGYSMRKPFLGYVRGCDPMDILREDK